jgi:amino acid adenylation domain-containing protein
MLTIDDSLPGGFERAAKAHRTRPAIGSGGWRPSYQELDETANRLAHALIQRGGQVGDRVAVLMQHDAPIIAAMLGVLKAGRIAVVLNPNEPASRLKELMHDAEPSLVLADRENGQVASVIAEECAVQHYESGTKFGPTADPGIRRCSDDVAFLCYTSGSTGRPKAVMRTHRQELRNAYLHAGSWGVIADDRIALLASLTGGLGISISWSALLHGAALFPFATMDEGFSGLAGMLTDDRITILASTASFFRAFTRSLAPGTIFPGIRVVRLSSEPVTADDFKEFQAHFSETANFVQTFGSSETGNIARLHLRRHDRVSEGRLPIGRPVEGIEVDLLNELGEKVAPGEVGEIVVRGRSLCAGYWRNAAATAAQFSEYPTGSGVRVFHSGDMARLNSEGLLEFAGRKDSRVKIRGYRVELLEVEHALLQLPGVERVFVDAIERPDEATQLTAYVVSRQLSSAGILRNSLRALLPDYMIPTAFMLVDDFPLTSHGKIDRSRLQQTISARPNSERPEISDVMPGANGEPRTKVQEMLLALWRDILKRQDIGADDDFFLCGGDSLSALNLFHRIESELHYQLPLTVLTEAPTVNLLSACLEAAERESVGQVARGSVSNMTRVNAAGRLRPLFVVHGVHGHTLGLVPTMRSLGADQPVFGLQPPRMDWASIGCTTVSQVAAHFIGEIKAVQAVGPYRLLGTSFGGLVVFEMALQLQNSGDSVEYLALVDSNPPTCLLDSGVDLWLGHPSPARQDAGPILKLHLHVYEQQIRMMSAYALDSRLNENIFRGELTFFCCTGSPIGEHDRRRLWQNFASRFRLLLLASPHDVGTPGSDRSAFQDLLRASLNGEVYAGIDPGTVFNRVYQIADRQGHEYILGSMGDTYRVQKDHMQGNLDGVFVEAETIQFKGWAVEPCRSQRALTIAVFLDNHYLGYGATSERRPDVADKLATPSVLHAGFNFHFKRKAIPNIGDKARVFILSNDGTAAELTDNTLLHFAAPQ